MRPVDKGLSPGDFKKYKLYWPYLEERLGAYCSYCEFGVCHSPHIEHKIPKGSSLELICDWANLIIACTYCNSTKSKHTYPIDGHFWPDLDDTARIFRIDLDSNNILTSHLEGAELERANSTLNMLGLNQTNKRNIKLRLKTINNARNALNIWETYDQQSRIALATPLLMIGVKSTGFLTVWLAVFQHHPDVRSQLIKAFPGTRAACYQ